MPAVGQCAICFSTLISSEIYCIKSCGHTFHQQCIIQWIRTGKNCSSCRIKASERDVIKLFIQETNLDDTLSTQNNPEAKVLELESKLEKANHKTKKLTGEKEKVEADNRTLTRKVTKIEKDLEKITILQVQLNSMHSLVDEHAAVQRQLAEANRKLTASNFYDLLTRKGKGTDEYKNYVNSNGAVIEENFIKLLTKEKDSLKQRFEELNTAHKALEKELKEEKKLSLKRKEACQKLTVELKELNAKYEKESGKAATLNPKLKNILNYSPDRKKARQSLGFTFESPEIPVDVLNSEKRPKRRIIVEDDDDVENDDDDENDTDYTPSKPSPQKKQKAFSFEASDSDSEWEPSSSGPSTSSTDVATPVPRFTRHASLNLKPAPKFGTTINDKRPTLASKKAVPQITTRYMETLVRFGKNSGDKRRPLSTVELRKSSTSSSSRDDSIICLDE